MLKKPDAHFSTFGFCQRSNRNPKNPKERKSSLPYKVLITLMRIIFENGK